MVKANIYMKILDYLFYRVYRNWQVKERSSISLLAGSTFVSIVASGPIFPFGCYFMFLLGYDSIRGMNFFYLLYIAFFYFYYKKRKDLIVKKYKKNRLNAR